MTVGKSITDIKHLEEISPALAVDHGLALFSDNESLNHHIGLNLVRIYKSSVLNFSCLEKIVEKLVRFPAPVYLIVETIHLLIREKIRHDVSYESELDKLHDFQTLRSEAVIRNITGDSKFLFRKDYLETKSNVVTIFSERKNHTVSFAPNKLCDSLNIFRSSSFWVSEIKLFKDVNKYYLYSNGEYIVGDSESICENSLASNYLYEVFKKSIGCEGFESSSGLVFIPRNYTPPRNYCHWLLDYLPSISLFSKYIGKNFFIPFSEPITEYQRESLMILGNAHPVHVKDGSLFYCAEVYSFSLNRGYLHPVNNGDPFLLSELRNLPRAGCLDDGRNGLINLYVSRNKSQRRHLLDEEELIQKLKRLDFEVLYPEDICWLDQVRLFERAKNIVSLHGAALSNMVFANQCLNVVEIFPPGYSTNAFQVLASSLGINYHYYFEGNGNECGSQFTDVKVDMDLLYDAVESVVSK